MRPERKNVNVFPLKFRSALRRTAVLLSLAFSLLSLMPLTAQTNSKGQGKPAQKVAPERAPVWQAIDAARKLDLDTLIAYVKAHAAEFDDSMIAYNAGFALEPFIKNNLDNTAKLQAKLTELESAFASVPPNGRTNFDWALARSLLKHDALLPFAEKVARRSTEDIPESEYVAAERREHDHYAEVVAKRAKDQGKPAEAPKPFDEQDATSRYKMDMSRRYTVLGDVEAKLGHDDAAERDLQHALDFKSNSDALRNLANLALKHGDKSRALTLYTAAYLRGQLDKDQVADFKHLYFELHPGAPETIERYLDTEYDKTFTIPAKYATYKATHNRTDSVALAEIFTGAGCESCVAVDLAIDAMLQQYSRNDLAVLLYQTSAPTDDPLSNRTVELREDYYQTQRSAPHTFLQGQEIPVEGEAPQTQAVLDTLDKKVDQILDRPSGAELHVTAVRNEDNVEVEVKGDAKDLPSPAHLQVMLVETEVTYSGENGLRYHPMVVRASANRTDNSTGYPIAGATFTRNCTFDLQQITTDNLKWYGDYLQALKKRLPPDFPMPGFREEKNKMNPNKLAVVVFLQDDKTKQVLQSAYQSISTNSSTREAGSANAN